jgi:hypothetical protein
VKVNLAVFIVGVAVWAAVHVIMVPDGVFWVVVLLACAGVYGWFIK